MLYRSYIKPLSVETTQGARARSPGPFGLTRLAAGGVLQAREDVDAHGHQTSGQAEQQNRLLSDLGNDGARQGEHIRHGGNNGSIALFATSAPASTEVGFMVASPFFKIFCM